MTRPATADTSVVVPAAAPWHEDHAVARAALANVDRLPAHVAVEAVSVLTRLPRGLARPAAEAVTVVLGLAPAGLLALDGDQHRRFLQAVGAAGVGGGRLYDALVGFTAEAHGLALVSLDLRAAPTYRSLGVEVRDCA